MRTKKVSKPRRRETKRPGGETYDAEDETSLLHVSTDTVDAPACDIDRTGEGGRPCGWCRTHSAYEHEHEAVD